MKGRVRKLVATLGFCLIGVAGAMAQQTFMEMVGPVQVGPVQQTAPLVVPYITWGGDMATFYANGGLETKPGTIFQKFGLNLKLVAGDDFIQQVRDYLAGKTPLLRGTFRMIGMASEAIGTDPRTKGYVILQLTWSAGDHMVAREGLRTLADLKGKTIALQQGGPHVGMLDDLLQTANLTWKDITVKWAKDLTATPNSPAEMLRKDASIDACFVISPDMIGLTGGLQSIGSGAEGTVKGAHVLASTAQLSKSIADVYVCRKDFYDANRDFVNKFVAGYLKACEEVDALRDEYVKKGSPKHMELLKLTQDIYGKDVIPTLEEDAHGLLSDCNFVYHAGNVAFFAGKDTTSFEGFQKKALDLAVNNGYAKVRTGFFPSGLDYNAIASLGGLTKTTIDATGRFDPDKVRGEITSWDKDALEKATVYDFSINFEPNQTEFSAEAYGAQFQRVLQLSRMWGNAVFAIRGHSDPTKVLREMVQVGQEKGIIKATGSPEDRRYFLQGRPLDLKATVEVIKLVESGQFGGTPEQTMQAARNLSLQRAQAVIESIVKYAQQQGAPLDKTQLTPVGVGIQEPVVAVPRSLPEAKENMRVEFRLIKVAAEAMKESDFAF